MVLTATDILSRLYPEAESSPGREGGRGRRLALPTTSQARLVLPADRRLASASLRQLRRPTSRVDGVLTAALAGAVRCGIAAAAPARMVFRPDHQAWNVEDEIGALLDRPVQATIFLGPARANRKPVLQIHDDQRALVAVAKVGVDDLTTGLVRAEAAALGVLAASAWKHVAVPELLAQHEWNGLHIVLQSPLPIAAATPDPARSRLTDAFTEIARCKGSVCQPLATSAYLRDLTDRVDAALDGDLLTLCRGLLAKLGADAESVIEFGAWHGDLTRWNMAATEHTVLVWDWERFEVGVPVGFDALHHEFLPALKGTGSAHDTAVQRLLERAPHLLTGWGPNRDRAEVVTWLYLLDLAARFVRDGQTETSVVGGDPHTWLLPALRTLYPLENGTT